MEEELEDELKLARKMKKEFCDKSGKELDPEKTAEILYKLGKKYKKRSPDKICLIKSVGLLNAAIVRKPFNLPQINSDLRELCRHILSNARAENQDVDLVKKAEAVKELVNALRKEIDQFLDKTAKEKAFQTKDAQIHKITAIKYINEVIATKYKKIMANLSQFCKEVMGKPPCEFAIVGMGSLARTEITPYSDFEHIMLLNDEDQDVDYKSYLEYFRWFSVIFHTIILNVQETIVPSLNITSLNDKNSDLGDWYFDAYTPRGISFDGMMPHACKFPLGRSQHTKNKPFETELIKPVSEMLEYLSSDANLKNGYQIADILTKTCFVFGNKQIFEQFENGVKRIWKCKSKPERLEEVEQQVKDDLDKFSTRLALTNLKSCDTINIKRVVFRSTTIFIAALGRIHNILANSCFDIINKMEKIGKVTQNTRDKLLFAVAIACEMRLRVYSKHKSQCENPYNEKENGENIEQFLNIVGAASTINYFQIAYCLQREVAKQLNFTKLRFYSDAQIINFTIGFAFGMSTLKTDFSNNQLQIDWNMSNFNFDACIEQLEKSNRADFVTKTAVTSKELNSMKKLADHLYAEKIYDEALEFYQQLLMHYQNVSSDEGKDESIAKTHNDIGKCMLYSRQHQDALNEFQQALIIFKEIAKDSKDEKYIGMTRNNIGLCLIEKHQYAKALTHLKESLLILRRITTEPQRDGDIALRLNNIGLCLMKMQSNDDALTNLNDSLKIRQNISLDKQKDHDVADTLNNIGLTLMNKHHCKDALDHLKQSLEIYRNLSHEELKDRDVAKTLNNVGLCLTDMHQYDVALIEFNQSLEIYKNISLNQQTDGSVADTLNNIGLCLSDKCQFNDALIHFNQSLEIFQNISLELQKDRDVADTLNNIGLCLTDIQHYDEALINLIQALEIYQSISRDHIKDRDIADTLNNIGLCLMGMKQYDNALIHLKQSLEIYRILSYDQRKDRDVAETLNNIGLCLTDIQHCDEALINLIQALEIYQSISRDHIKDRDIADVLNNIGNCLICLQQHDKALLHFKQSLEIYKCASSDCGEDRDVAKIFSSISLCLQRMDQYDDALIHLKQSLTIYQNLAHDEQISDDVAESYCNIGLLCLRKLHHYKDAQNYLEKALGIYQNLPFDDHIVKRITDICEYMEETAAKLR